MTLAITWYQWFLAAHVVAAVIWVGGGFTLIALSMAARRQRDPEQEIDLVMFAGKIGGPVYGAASWILLGFGFALVQNGHWGYDQFFVQFGLAVWLFSTVLGIVYYSREVKGLEAAAARGADDPEARMRLNRYYRVGTIDAAVLLAAVFVMSAKPWL
jgi:uncharacterized membrane protein